MIFFVFFVLFLKCYLVGKRVVSGSSGSSRYVVLITSGFSIYRLLLVLFHYNTPKAHNAKRTEHRKSVYCSCGERLRVFFFGAAVKSNERSLLAFQISFRIETANNKKSSNGSIVCAGWERSTRSAQQL